MGTTIKCRLPKELAPALCPHTLFLVLLTLAGVEQLHQMIGKQLVKVGQSLEGVAENLRLAVVFQGLRFLEEREFQLHLVIPGCPHDDPLSYGQEWKESCRRGGPSSGSSWALLHLQEGAMESCRRGGPGSGSSRALLHLQEGAMDPVFCRLAAERSEGHNGPELSLEP